MTSRLYFDDPALLDFDATVVACDAHADGARVALDRSAFYPTSGGQPHDTGVLIADGQALAVTDVVADDEGVVWHALAGPIAPGRKVQGRVDAARRQDFRQQHSGQHILSAAFDARVGARTESVHLGVDACTIDLHREVDADECLQAEAAANVVVWEDRPVAIRYADAADLVAEPRLRKQTLRTGRVRLVDVEGHDLSACGGTHVTRTGEVGMIVLRGTERFRGGTRVTFLCGRRALESHRDLRDCGDAAARALSVSVGDLPQAVERLRDDLRTEQRRSRDLAARLVELQVASLAQQVSADGTLVAHLPDADAQAVRLAASHLVSATGRVVALLAGDAPHALVVARSADRTDVDAGAVVRQACATFGGKGGGRPDLAQAGGVAATPEQLRALLRS